MDRDQLLGLIDSLDPAEANLPEALSFILVVIKNNPLKTPEQILARPDVQEAYATLGAWAAKANDVATQVADTLQEVSAEIAEEIVTQVEQTVEGLTNDGQMSADRVGVFQGDSAAGEGWAAAILLRIKWLIRWLRAQVEHLMLGTPYKRWVSRLASNTCHFCRTLHGTVLPVGASFALEAARAGWKWPYGGLFAPPLHPECQCRLVGVTKDEFDALDKAQPPSVG